MVDGDTEFCNSQFTCSAAALVHSGSTLTPEQPLASSSSQADVDYELAMHLSMQTNSAAVAGGTIAAIPGIAQDATIEVGIPVHPPPLSGAPVSSAMSQQESADHMLALQLQEHHHTASGAQTVDGEEDAASLQLARQLQNQEDQRAAAGVVRDNAVPQTSRPNSRPTAAAAQNCAIM